MEENFVEGCNLLGVITLYLYRGFLKAIKHKHRRSNIMNKVLKRVITAAASGASIISLAFVNNMPLMGKIALVLTGIISVTFLIYSEAKADEVNERVCQNDDEIKAAMRELVKSEGKVAIMSRDLSWVDTEMEACISMKKENMLICVEKETELTRRLVRAGVVVKCYGHVEFEPISRFTIIRFNKKDHQVAIAKTESSVRKKNTFKHVIYQTLPNGNKQDEWINSLAVDMITLCSLIGEEINGNDNM